MNSAKPMFDLATHYRIQVQGRVDMEWLQSFDSSAEINDDETGHKEDMTVFDVHMDQSGIVGLVRRLHGLGVTILQFKIIPSQRKADGVEE